LNFDQPNHGAAAPADPFRDPLDRRLNPQPNTDRARAAGAAHLQERSPA
jgi:hypothetical protein